MLRISLLPLGPGFFRFSREKLQALHPQLLRNGWSLEVIISCNIIDSSSSTEQHISQSALHGWKWINV